MNDKRTIIITGAASGIGKALAYLYADSQTRLFLIGRTFTKLEEVARICQQKGAIAHTICVDVCDKDLMQSTMDDICNKYKVALIICCAGISAGTARNIPGIEQIQEVIDTNLFGTIYTVMPAIPYMINQKHGSIAIISSMAGLIGLPNSVAYCVSKSAVKTFGESLRANLSKYEINVSIVIPGYVDTPMTAVNNFPMPLKICASDAAIAIKKGLEAKKRIIAFPMIMYIILKIANLLPSKILDYITSKTSVE